MSLSGKIDDSNRKYSIILIKLLDQREMFGASGFKGCAKTVITAVTGDYRQMCRNGIRDSDIGIRTVTS